MKVLPTAHPISPAGAISAQIQDQPHGLTREASSSTGNTIRAWCGKLLERYFSLAESPKSLQPLLKETRPVVIVTLSDSTIIGSLLSSLFKQHGLSISPLTLGTEKAPRFSWVSLHNLEPLRQLLTVDPTVVVSTLNIFHFRGPARTNPSYRMGLRQHMRILWDARTMFVIFGEPFRPAEGSITSLPRISRHLKLDFYRNLKLVRGTPFQDIATQERVILSGHEFERELRIIAQREGLSIEAARKRAQKEFHAFAANPRRAMYGIMAPVARFIINRLFSEVRLEGLDRLKESVQSSTVVLVPMHRSHLDYVVLGSTLYDSCLNPPLVAAGVNLRFWPAGPIIRSLGAYFVKRQARQDRIHALLLKRYVSYLIKRGHMQEFFIEGGRSRSGRMRPPKLGLLGVIAEASAKKARESIQLVPVSLSYEQVIEDKVYGDENSGRPKEKENFAALIRARKIFKKKYGELIVTFGTPLRVEEYVARSKDSRTAVVDMGLDVSRRIRDQTHVTLTGLAYTALLSSPSYGLPRAKLIESIHSLATHAAVTQSALLKNNGTTFRRDANATVAGPAFTKSLTMFLAGADELLVDVLKNGFIQYAEVLGQEVLFVRGQKRFSAEFYKNSILHLFFVPGILATLQSRFGIASWPRIKQIHGWLMADFLLASWESFEREVRAVTDQYVTRGFASLTEEGILLNTDVPGYEILQEVLSAPLESHWWVLEQLKAHLKGAATGEFAYKIFEQKLVSESRAAIFSGVLRRTEAGSQANVLSALDTLASLKLITIAESNGKRSTLSVSQFPLEMYEFLAILTGKSVGRTGG